MKLTIAILTAVFFVISGLNFSSTDSGSVDAVAAVFGHSDKDDCLYLEDIDKLIQSLNLRISKNNDLIIQLQRQAVFEGVDNDALIKLMREKNSLILVGILSYQDQRQGHIYFFHSWYPKLAANFSTFPRSSFSG